MGIQRAQMRAEVTPAFQPVQFANCQRIQPTVGIAGCVFLATDHDVGICADCFAVSIAPIPALAQHFVTLNGFRVQFRMFSCSMARVWTRLAWLEIVCCFRSSWAYDMEILSRVAHVKPQDGPCPNGLTIATPKVGGVVRLWYTIRHPETGALLDDFTFCSFCKASLDQIVPNTRSMWVVAGDGKTVAGTCDCDSNSERFTKYIGMILDAANDAVQLGGRPNLKPFADAIALTGRFEECHKHQKVNGKRHHLLQLSGLSVCESCYTTHVAGSRLVNFVSATSSFTQGFRCHMSSERVLQIWRNSVTSGDGQLFLDAMRQRADKLAQNKSRKEALQLGIRRADFQALQYSARVIGANSAEAGRRMAGDYYFASSGPTMSEILQDRSAEERVKANRMRAELNDLEVEWSKIW